VVPCISRYIKIYQDDYYNFVKTVQSLLAIKVGVCGADTEYRGVPTKLNTLSRI
jgi:hypothetical protein